MNHTTMTGPHDISVLARLMGVPLSRPPAPISLYGFDRAYSGVAMGEGPPNDRWIDVRALSATVRKFPIENAHVEGTADPVARRAFYREALVEARQEYLRRRDIAEDRRLRDLAKVSK